jgi:hypothetical protein
MKTIKEKVESMSISELRSLTERHYVNNYIEMQMNILKSIIMIQSFPKENKGDVWEYNQLKEDLEREEWFNPRVEELYQKAIKGTLDLKEVQKEYAGLLNLNYEQICRSKKVK